MATKTGNDLEALRALLDEVKALREGVETRGAELRRDWGAAAEKAASRAINLSHYIALRGHDLNDLQLRLAARGLSSLGRSEAKVAATLDALIVTLQPPERRGRRPLPCPAVARASASELEAEAAPPVRQAAEGAPRVRVMATLPPEAANQPELVDTLARGGHGLRAHQLRPRRRRSLGPDGRARARSLDPARAPLQDPDGPRRPQVPHPARQGAAEGAARPRRPRHADRRAQGEDQGPDRLLAQLPRARRPARRSARRFSSTTARRRRA